MNWWQRFLTAMYILVMKPKLFLKMRRMTFHIWLCHVGYILQVRSLRTCMKIMGKNEELDGINLPENLFFVLSSIGNKWKSSGFYATTPDSIRKETAKIPGQVYMVLSLQDIKTKIVENYMNRMAYQWSVEQTSAKNGGHYVH